PPGTSMSWSPATGPLPRVPRWRPALPPIVLTSTRWGEEGNRPTRVWVKTGSPASTSRTWSRPDTHPDELRRHRAPGRHPVSLRSPAAKAASTDDPHRHDRERLQSRVRPLMYRPEGSALNSTAPRHDAGVARNLRSPARMPPATRRTGRQGPGET